jgi:hypothetical protein
MSLFHSRFLHLAAIAAALSALSRHASAQTYVFQQQGSDPWIDALFYPLVLQRD